MKINNYFQCFGDCTRTLTKIDGSVQRRAQTTYSTHTDMQTERHQHTNTHTHRHANREVPTHKHTDMQTERHQNTHTHVNQRGTNKHTHKHTFIKIFKLYFRTSRLVSPLTRTTRPAMARQLYMRHQLGFELFFLVINPRATTSFVQGQNGAENEGGMSTESA